MARLARPRRRERDNAWPGVMVVMLARQPAADAEHGGRNLLVTASMAVPFHQGGRGLPECAGVNLHRQAVDTTMFIELDDEVNAASAGRRPDFGAAILTIEWMRLAQRSSQPQDLGRVERLDHSLRQVVPFGPSSKTMPSDLSSSRIRSAVAKSRFFFAAVRSAMRASISPASSPP